MRCLALLLTTCPLFCTSTTEPPPVVFNASQIGLLDLPHAPAHSAINANCFKDACTLEAAGRFEEAFKWYESKYAAIGDAGWNLTGHSHGRDAAVAFKRTPCGTHVVVKGSRWPATISHIAHECGVLKNLTNNPSCPHCFPRYYYYSPVSKACYSQFIHIHGFEGTIRSDNKLKPTFLPSIRAILLHALTILRTLWDFRLQHGDISLRNMGLHGDINITDPQRKGLQLIVYDFGAARYFWEPLDPNRPPAGNRGMSDLHTVACDVLRSVYSDSRHCREHVLPLPKSNDGSLKFALLKIMHDNQAIPRVAPKLAEAEALIRNATHA